MPARPPRSLTLALEDGTTVGPATRPKDEGEDVLMTRIEEISPRLFVNCPICGSPATHREHVPPEKMGGRVMTRTCKPCNNRLGSNVEVDLSDWFFKVVAQAQFRSANMPGARKSRQVAVLETSTREFSLILDDYDPDVRAMLASGEVDVEVLLPDPNRRNVALLKHAHLAACMRFGVPEGEVADRIRSDLIAARDADGPRNVPTSALAMGLTTSRRDEMTPAAIPRVAWARAQDAGGTYEGVLLAGHAGQVFICWPLDPATSLAVTPPPHRLSIHLKVGNKIDGTVLSVEP